MCRQWCWFGCVFSGSFFGVYLTVVICVCIEWSGFRYAFNRDVLPVFNCSVLDGYLTVVFWIGS